MDSSELMDCYLMIIMMTISLHVIFQVVILFILLQHGHNDNANNPNRRDDDRCPFTVEESQEEQ